MPRRVLAREGTAARILGLSIPEYGILGITMLVLHLLQTGMAVGTGVFFLVYLFLRKIRRELPDNFLWNFVRYWYRKDFHYRASEPDTESGPYLIDNE